jgi:hypothetical protein
LDEGHEAVGGLVVAGGNAAPMFELVEEALDAIAQGVEGGIDRTLDLAIGLCGNDRIGAMKVAIGAHIVAVVALIAQHVLRAGLVRRHQLGIGRDVVRLAAGQSEAEGQAFLVRAGMKFCRKATARAAKTLFVSPPFAPAA